MKRKTFSPPRYEISATKGLGLAWRFIMGLAYMGLESEVSKRGWREGVGDKQTPKKEPKKFSRNVSPFS